MCHGNSLYPVGSPEAQVLCESIDLDFLYSRVLLRCSAKAVCTSAPHTAGRSVVAEALKRNDMLRSLDRKIHSETALPRPVVMGILPTISSSAVSVFGIQIFCTSFYKKHLKGKTGVMDSSGRI